MTDTGVGAWIFTPCNVGVSLDGIHSAIAPQTVAIMTNHALPAVDIPVDACRRLRDCQAEAEVGPALSGAGHLVVKDSGSNSV